jgi:hypothetical protein
VLHRLHEQAEKRLGILVDVEQRADSQSPAADQLRRTNSNGSGGDDRAVLVILSQRNRSDFVFVSVRHLHHLRSFFRFARAFFFAWDSVANMSAGGAKSWISNEQRMNFNNFDIRIRSDDFCFLTFQKNYPDVRINRELTVLYWCPSLELRGKKMQF